jgi:glycosyltransferase involved in cell wall biosynthesis
MAGVNDPAQPLLTVVIPAFNEAGNIHEVAAEALAALAKHGIMAFEIVFVDDGSTDGTTEVLKSLQLQDSRVQVCFHEKNRGLGAALKTGFKHSCGELLVWTSADGQITVDDILQGLPYMENNDIVIALRKAVRSTWRAAITKCFHLLIRLLFKFDAADMCGVYIIRRSVLEEINPRSDNVFLNVEIPILCLRNHKRLGHFIVSVKPRLSGKSKVSNMKTMARNLVEMLKIRYSGNNLR